jgi:hypothetical protein
MNFKYTRHFSGQLELSFSDDCSFRTIKAFLIKNWSARIVKQFGWYDQLWMELSIKQSTFRRSIFRLHEDVFAGLSLVCEEPEGEELLQRIGDDFKVSFAFDE